MAENIVERVKRIISGGANAIVTAVEDAAPRVVLVEAVAEVDRAYDDLRADLGKLVARKHLINREMDAKKSKHAELSGQIELAITEGRDDLAEAAVSKQLDIEVQVPVLEESASEVDAQISELEGYIAALKAKKREMEDDIANFDKTQKEAESLASDTGVSGGAANGNHVHAVDKATNAFDRVLSNATGVNMDRDNVDPAALKELESLSRKNRIQERLEAMKTKLKDAS